MREVPIAEVFVVRPSAVAVFLGIMLRAVRHSQQVGKHHLCHTGIEVIDKDGRVVPDAEIKLHAELTGAGKLAGFGSANPITEDNYTDGDTTSFRGRAMAIIRAGYEAGDTTLTVFVEGFESMMINLRIV